MAQKHKKKCITLVNMRQRCKEMYNIGQHGSKKCLALVWDVKNVKYSE